MTTFTKTDVLDRFQQRLNPPIEACLWVQANWDEIGSAVLALANGDGLDVAVTELRNLHVMSMQRGPQITPMIDKRSEPTRK